MIRSVSDWMDEVASRDFIWYVKRLSGNDTLANETHQAGPYITREFLFRVFPSMNREDILNPDKRFDLVIDSHADRREARAVWYNNKFHGGTRNESRLTNFGGAASPLLDPESTGALAVFAFLKKSGTDADECHVWVCRDSVEEDMVEERIGPVEPGKWKVWSLEEEQEVEEGPVCRARTSCWLSPEEIPPEWLEKFPSPVEIILKTVAMRPDHGLSPDLRLLKRRECEYEIFQSIEEAIELPFIKKGFVSVEDFISRAQTILQRRKARAGRSFELHTREIFVEEGLREGEDFSHQPESDPGKKPDFLFPSESAYKNAGFSESKLRMLAVKTTCRDRWRQILNEADRIKNKHLFTLQQGVSENQFREMAQSGVMLVVPADLMSFYPAAVRPHLQSFESFIGDVRLLNI